MALYQKTKNLKTSLIDCPSLSKIQVNVILKIINIQIY